MNPCLTIIVPIYNSKAYLEECLDSLCAVPGIEDNEIILVDDGSTDGSAVIADDYSKKHGYISVIHNKNSGPSVSRNAGLSQANGKYIFFCDSDDIVDSDMLSSVIKLMKTEDVDIVLWNTMLIDSNGAVMEDDHCYQYRHDGLNETDGIITGKSAMEKQLRKRGDFVATVWMGAYRRAYLTDHDLFFMENIIHEDELWAPQVLLNAERVMYYPGDLYHYRIHEGSIIRPEKRDWTKHIESALVVYPRLYEYYDSVLKDDPVKRLIEKNLTQRYLYKIFEYDFCKYGYSDKVDKRVLWKKSGRIKDRIKIIILLIKERFNNKR